MSTQGDKRHASMIKKYGSEEAYQAAMKAWGSKGGKRSTTSFDKLTPERRREIAKLGHIAFLESIRRGGSA